MRRMTKAVLCRNVQIGGGAPVVIQSMTNTDTRDAEATFRQVSALAEAGCRIVRVAVPDAEAVAAFGQLRKMTEVPLVADIHFDYRLAVGAIHNGADAVRINPGNIGSRERVKAVIDTAKEYRIPVRIGVNSGSVEKEILARYGGVTAEGLAESVLGMVREVEEMDFDDIVISVKASDVVMNYRTCLLVSEKTDHPLHIGVTESGTSFSGTIKSSAGIGALLLAGVGDTLRVSLTGDPLREIPVAREILKCTGNYDGGINFVSCPTCSRCRTDLEKITSILTERLAPVDAELIRHGAPEFTVAVMGCAVNGPGEARMADIGVACGDGKGLIFKDGEIIRAVPEQEIADTMFSEILEMTGIGQQSGE